MATRGTGASPANVTKHLKGIDFPADKQDLLKQAKQLHAEKVVIDEIQRMDDRQYSSMSDVMKSFQPEQEQSKTRSSSSSSSPKSSQTGHGKTSHGRSSSHK